MIAFPRARAFARISSLLVTTVLTTMLAGCGSKPAAPPGLSPSATSPSPTSSSPAGSTPADAVVLDIALENGRTSPNGTKIDVRRGQTVRLNVVSDHADQVHVHGDYDINLDVTAGTPVTRSFVADSPGSVEVESHHPEKVIAILNVR